MREAIRGYFDAVAESAAADGQVRAAADDLRALLSAVETSEDLRAALSDPGHSARSRRAVVSELLAGKVAPATAALVAYTVEVDRAPEVVANLSWLATAASGAGGAVESDMLGRSASRERIDGYATAVLAPLTGADDLGEVEDDLFRFARVVEGSEELTAVLTDREVPAERRSALVADLLGSRGHAAFNRLAAYAARYGRPRDYLATLEWLVDRVAAEANRRVAEVRSAVELDGDQRRRLGEALSRITGRQVELRVSVEGSLLGGFVASVGDTVIDGSARHRLELLKERLSLPNVDLLTGTGEAS